MTYRDNAKPERVRRVDWGAVGARVLRVVAHLAVFGAWLAVTVGVHGPPANLMQWAAVVVVNPLIVGMLLVLPELRPVIEEREL